MRASMRAKLLRRLGQEADIVSHDPLALREMIRAKGIRPRGRLMQGVDTLEFTLSHLAAHPGAFFKLAGARVVNLWRPTFEGSSLANIIVLGGSYGVLMVLAVYGMARAWPRRGRAAGPYEGATEKTAGSTVVWNPARPVLWGTVAYPLVLHLFFWSEIRYRQYVMPFLSVFAGYAAADLSVRLRAKQRGALA